MNMSKLLVSALVALPFGVQAAVVDLSAWTAEGGSSSWNVQPGNDTVYQTVNGDPTVFFDPASTGSQGTALSGNIKQTDLLPGAGGFGNGDDDFIGFVLGYNSGELSSSSTDFFPGRLETGGSSI